MNKFLTIPFLFLTLAFVSSTYAQETIEITNDEVREITTRLQSYSQSELIERQLFLQNELQEMEEGDSSNGASQGRLKSSHIDGAFHNRTVININWSCFT